MKRTLILAIYLAFSLSTIAKVKGYPTIYSEYKEDFQREYPDKEVTNYWLSYYHTENGEFGKMEKMENSGKWSIMPCWQIPS